ncbi:MAG: hypothetical protein AAF620_10740 [Bacteroidota bacterium]
MKKLVVKSIVLVVLLLGYSSASIAASWADLSVVVLQDENKTEISAEDIPEAVQETYNASYGEFPIEKAYQVTSDAGINYELVVTVEGQKWALIFAENGDYLDKTEVS